MTHRTTTDTTTSTAPPRRLLAPDLARGIMLLLIAMAYAGVYAGAGFGSDTTGEPLLDRAASFASALFLDNRAFPMFAILFGYGLAWSVGRRSQRGLEPTDQRRRLRRRALLLLVLGALHAVLIFPGDILTAYGLALLVTGWLLFRSDRALTIAIAVTGLFYLVSVPLVMLAASFAPGDSFAQEIAGYTGVVDWVSRLIGPLFGPLYVAIAYPLLLLVLLGYWAGRALLFERTVARGPLLRAVAGIGIAVSVLGALPAGLIALGVLEVGPLAKGLLLGLQVLTGVVGGAGYAACFALGAERLQERAPALTRTIAAIGKRSLTFYLLNSLLVAIILHSDLIGLGSFVGHFGALVAAATSWMLGLLVAAWMEHTDRQGPAEVLMRRAVDGSGARGPRSRTG